LNHRKVKTAELGELIPPYARKSF